MTIPFHKYQGTGNDFIMIDNRSLFFPKNNTKLVAQLCDRKFGVGADGLILLENHEELDFTMVYYNSDGNLSSMCGNGGRCLVHFARSLDIINSSTVFEAIDGTHEASIHEDNVSLKMNNVIDVLEKENDLFLNTGSPHHIVMVDKIRDIDVRQDGAKIRFGLYGKEGANVNFVESKGENIFAVRTYERGVEDETLSCGTGVTAVAIAMSYKGLTSSNSVQLDTPGGELSVTFEERGEAYINVYLNGPAKMVFEGMWKL